MSDSKQITLITGANRQNGLGFMLARTLARDHGFLVLLGSRNVESGAASAAVLQKEGLSVEPLTIDVTDDSSIATAAKEVDGKYGHIDVLVNNAGVSIDYKYESFSREMYQQTFNTNVFGSASVTEHFAPLLQKSTLPPPRIVFLASMLGSISDRVKPDSIYDGVDCISYRTSKAAVNMLAAAYARRFSDEGWKVNTVCPGFVTTDINLGAGAISPEQAMPNLVRVCTLGKDGETGTFSDPNGRAEW